MCKLKEIKKRIQECNILSKNPLSNTENGSIYENDVCPCVPAYTCKWWVLREKSGSIIYPTSGQFWEKCD